MVNTHNCNSRGQRPCNSWMNSRWRQRAGHELLRKSLKMEFDEEMMQKCWKSGWSSQRRHHLMTWSEQSEDGLKAKVYTPIKWLLWKWIKEEGVSVFIIGCCFHPPSVLYSSTVTLIPSTLNVCIPTFALICLRYICTIPLFHTLYINTYIIITCLQPLCARKTCHMCNSAYSILLIYLYSYLYYTATHCVCFICSKWKENDV